MLHLNKTTIFKTNIFNILEDVLPASWNEFWFPLFAAAADDALFFSCLYPDTRDRNVF